jgi:chemotaxis protein MotB
VAGKADKDQIVIKRVKKGGHGFHGGVWKLVYADFVTAMMAFFLLMWVLGSTTTGDLAGISSYFQNPLRLTIQGGDSAGNSEKIIKGGGPQIFRTDGLEARSNAETNQRRVSELDVLEDERKRINARMQQAREAIEQQLRSDSELGRMRDQVFMDVSTDGLRIQIVDDQNRSMFPVGGADIAPFAKNLLRIVGSVLGEMPNSVRIEGHTDGLPYSGSPAGYSNWELSAERANAARRELVLGGLSERQVSAVVGLADTVKLNPGNPNDPLNRRISITVQQIPASSPRPTGSTPTQAPASTVTSAPAATPSASQQPTAGSAETAGRTPVLVLPPRPQIVPAPGSR